MKIAIDQYYASETIRAYIDRHLDPTDEQGFEEAMLMDEHLADQVQAEMALRRGYAELARREPTAAPRRDPHQRTATASQRATHQSRSGRSRILPFAAAAALFAFAAVPTYMLLLSRQDQAALEARITASLDGRGNTAAYQLPASLVTQPVSSTQAPVEADGPVRIRLPESVREVSLELPSSDLSAPTRLKLAHADSPEMQFTLAGQPLAAAGAIDFRIGSDRLLPGKYQVTVQRQQGDTWVTDREFTLNIDGATR